MSRLFISHSSLNDDWALAIRTWLVREGWGAESDIFLDVDPERGIAAGQRWAEALTDASTRCEVVLFLVSEAWLASKWCNDEYQLASSRGKKLFALLVDDVSLDRLPGGLVAQWQIMRLKGEPTERFLTRHPSSGRQSPVHIAEAALVSLRRGLDKAGISAETFDLQRDPQGPGGWRPVYRGLEALEPEDAAVFFGRDADLVRGIDALRRLATQKPPLLLVVLGASGAGKSSVLRAGLYPRLLRDDGQWLPLRPIRAGRGGAIEGTEGLLPALEDAHRRFGLPASRADLRRSLATPDSFVTLLQKLRNMAARRTLLAEALPPLPILCLDQAEELFTADAGPESTALLNLARHAAEAAEALLLVTIRSDAYGLMQQAAALAGVDQQPFSLGPVPQGEIARLIRDPAELLRRRAGPSVPVFDATVVARLQDEIEGEADALPLLAFVLQRLMREHAAAGTIGLAELEATGGVAAAIESEAEAALADAGFGPDRAARQEALRRLFIPRLARIDPASKAPQRRVGAEVDLPGELRGLARALTERRLLVVKLAAQSEASPRAATIEVAHEALLRRWPTLAELLAEDRDAMLLLDGVLSAAMDWAKAEEASKGDYLAHRGSRLVEAQALAARGLDWQREAAPAASYLAACAARDGADREERDAALAREAARLAEAAAAQERQGVLQRRARWALAAVAAVVILAAGLFAWVLARDRRELAARAVKITAAEAKLTVSEHQVVATEQQVAGKEREVAEAGITLRHAHANLFGELAEVGLDRGDIDGALRFAVQGTQADRALPTTAFSMSPASSTLATALVRSDWRTIMKHDGAVSSAAFSPDGARIITASWDKTARIWDAATGREVTILRGHGDRVRTAAFSPDGARVLTASDDGTARIWDAATGREIMIFRGHETIVWDAAWSPDGTRIVTASWDRTVRIWDATTGQQLVVLREDGANLPSASWSPDGTRIVTASWDGTARVWDAATGQEMLRLHGGGLMLSAAFNPDGTRIIASSNDETARVWDAATGREITVLRGHMGSVISAVFSPDGSSIMTTSFDATVRIWNAATGSGIAVLRGHEGLVNSAVMTRDGTRIVTASDDRTARIWDVAAGRDIQVFQAHEDSVSFAAFSPDGTRVVTASADKTARVWDAETGRELAALRGHEGYVRSAAWSPDGRRIVTASLDKTARIWDVATGRAIRVLLGHEDGVHSAAFSPDGTRIVTASRDHTARLWDAATGQELMVFRGHEELLISAEFSPDGARIVTASGDSTARVWDVATGEMLLVLRGHELHVNSAAFSPDGKRIVTSDDRAARLLDAATGEEIMILRGHDYSVESVAFSPDGRHIVTASFDKTARVWDAATGREIEVLRGHDDSVNSAFFSPDGMRIVTASGDRTARIWDVHFATMLVDRLLVEACTRRLRGISTMTRDEMRLAGYPDTTPAIDVCTDVH